MKNRKVYKDPSAKEMIEDVVGTKVLYNWLYAQEEKDYYLDKEVLNPTLYFLEEEGLFVESASFSD